MVYLDPMDKKVLGNPVYPDAQMKTEEESWQTGFAPNNMPVKNMPNDNGEISQWRTLDQDVAGPSHNWEVDNQYQKQINYQEEIPDLLPDIPNVDGIVNVGNINLDALPVINNAKGDYAGINAMAVNTGGGTMLLPKSGKGTAEEAFNKFKETGQNLGVFASQDAATMYANTLHKGILSDNDLYSLYSQKAPKQIQDPLSMDSKPNPGGNIPVSGTLATPNPQVEIMNSNMMGAQNYIQPAAQPAQSVGGAQQPMGGNSAQGRQPQNSQAPRGGGMRNNPEALAALQKREQELKARPNTTDGWEA